MKRFIEGEERSQVTLLPECLDDYIAEDNPVRVVDVFVDELKLQGLGFDSAEPAATGSPSYHPAVFLKIYIYGYLNNFGPSKRVNLCHRCADMSARNGPSSIDPLWPKTSLSARTTHP